VSGDEIVLALAKLAVIPVADGLAPALDGTSADSQLLIDLDRPGVAEESAWQERIQRALAERVVAQVRLKFASGERYRYRHGHRWRFWRKIPATHKA
jgi:hypothetical protein